MLEVDNTEASVDENEVDLIVQKMDKGKVITIDEPIKFIRAAFNRSYAITTDNSVYLWGEDFNNK